MNKKLFSRIALFIIYFWFGILKVIGKSPASPLVIALLHITLPFIPAQHFLIFFGLFECLIGILFLFQKFTKITLALFSVHIILTLLPLIMLPHLAWSGYFIPTFEGQYIIKNVALIALAYTLI